MKQQQEKIRRKKITTANKSPAPKIRQTDTAEKETAPFPHTQNKNNTKHKHIPAPKQRQREGGREGVRGRVHLFLIRRIIFMLSYSYTCAHQYTSISDSSPISGKLVFFCLK